MNDIHLFVPTYRIEETLAEIRICLERGWTGLGFRTLEFERDWKEYLNVEHAHFLNSCTAALRLAVKLLKEQHEWNDGDEVITTPLTFVSTNHAILYEHLTPVFADVDEYLCLNPISVLKAITPKTRAVMFVGLGGNIGRLEAIAKICQEHGLALIVDAAHMAGTRFYGTTDWARWADATCFSFHAVKNLPTADGGMLCFQDESLDARARKLSWLGIDKDTFNRTTSGGAYKWQYRVEDVGFKMHGNSIMAAIGLVALRHLDQDNAYRRQIAAWYDELLVGVQRVPVMPRCESSRHLYQVLIPCRDQIILALNAQGVYLGCHYELNTSYPMYSTQPPERAHAISQQALSLPMHLRLTHDDVVRVAEALLFAVKKVNG